MNAKQKHGALREREDVTPLWLTETLRRSSSLPTGEVRDVTMDVTTSFTATIARLVPIYSKQAPATAPPRLFLKIARSDPGQRVVGRKQWRAEVELHTEVAQAMDNPPFVRCYDACFDNATGAAHLLFDDVSETHDQTEHPLPPTKAACEKVMDAFAEFHAFWWDHPALRELRRFPTESSVADYVSSVQACFPRFAEALGDRLSQHRRRIYDRVLASLPKLFARQLSGPTLSGEAGANRCLTLIHGDANFWNVLLPREPSAGRALIIDWQLWGVSYAAEDLANLIALYWYRDRREVMEHALLRRYYAGLQQAGVEDYPWEVCWHDYRLAVVLRALFMPMWIWSSGQPARAWWHGLECAFQAFEDLGCDSLLD
ncbi:MAG: phosphotransferase [Anaerolineae bacterium]